MASASRLKAILLGIPALIVGLTVVSIGTSLPISRSGAQTCTAVFVNGQFLVFDVGNNANQAMYDANMPIQDIDAVFLTHYHNDHIADLGETIQNSWIAGREHTLEVYGPTGVTSIHDAPPLIAIADCV